MLFYVYIAQICLGTVSYMTSAGNFRRVVIMLIAFGSYIIFGAWIYGWYTRCQHSARVCSGEYLKAGESTTGFLIQQGAFLYYSLVLVAIIFALTFVCGIFGLIMACCRGNRNYQSQKDEERNDIEMR